MDFLSNRMSEKMEAAVKDEHSQGLFSKKSINLSPFVARLFSCFVIVVISTLGAGHLRKYVFIPYAVPAHYTY